MSELIAVGYDDKFKADEVLNTLNKLQREHLIDLADAAVVVRDDNGKVKLKQSHNLVASGAAGGGLWGGLIGLLFLNPLIGILVGAGSGAVIGALTDIGINDDFMKELGGTLEPGTSALFVLVRKATPDKVAEELKGYGGKILRTSLSKDDEAELRRTLEGHREAMDAVENATEASA